MQKSRAPLHPGQPIVHSESHCAEYVTRKFALNLGQRAAQVLGYLLERGWTYCEIYQLGRHNPDIYDDTQRMLALHERLVSSGVELRFVKKILTSRVLPRVQDGSRIVQAIRRLESYGMDQTQLMAICHKKPRILLLSVGQIDACWSAAAANGTKFSYRLRKMTTASADCPDRRPALLPQNKRPATCEAHALTHNPP